MELQKIYGTWTDKTTYGKSKFTIDVLNKSFQMDLISKDDLYRVSTIWFVISIPKSILPICFNEVSRHSNGQSSSIKVETAEEIMNSIWYAVDSYNIKFETIEDIVNTISNKRFLWE